MKAGGEGVMKPEKASLKRAYVNVRAGRQVLFGGSQMRGAKKTFQASACGLISAVDFLLYLGRQHPEWRGPKWPSGWDGEGPIDEDEYFRFVKHLQHWYLPVIPYIGMTGFRLAIGLNWYFRRNRIPLRCRWGVFARNFYARMADMLKKDLPVILAVGPNFPPRFHKVNCAFYVQRSDGTYRKSTQTNAHFINAVSLDDEWIGISSWGQPYFIRREEYETYRRKASNALFCSLLYVRERKVRQ